ncbi:hypothetical protein [Nonomuraea sp. NPDC050643]|uniref:hypothetical protein n=1 Tax=Nonomuraea sp. NPDC050643 TaxID=3155660 RepID=UPI0033C950E6
MIPSDGRLVAVEALADRHPALPLVATHRDDDVISSTRRTILFPTDGNTFTINAAGLTPSGRQEPGRVPAT